MDNLDVKKNFIQLEELNIIDVSTKFERPIIMHKKFKSLK